MKKNSYLFLLLLFVMSMVGCTEKDTESTERIVKPSYPTVTLKGNSVVLLAKGTPYTDAGATGTDDITKVTSELKPYEPQNYFVDSNTPGSYQVVYHMMNENGYETQATRLVVVFDPATQKLSSEDLSGTYRHNSGGRIVKVEKRGEGLFWTDDIYGTYVNWTPMYFVNFTSGLLVPTQNGGDLGAINGTGTVTKNATGKYVLNFSGLQRVGIGGRPRAMTQQ